MGHLSLISLPSEVLRYVFEYLPTPDALNAKLSCRTLCDVYDFWEKDSLTSQILRRIEPGVLYDAVAAVCAPVTTGAVPDVLVLGPFLQEYIDNSSGNGMDDPELPTDLPTLRKLDQLSLRVDRFVKEFFYRSMDLLRHGKGNAIWYKPNCNTAARFYEYDRARAVADHGTNIAPMSDVERYRIQLAFYRFELLSRCFLSIDGDGGNTAMSLFPGLTNVMDIFEQWEIEEIACVHTYFTFELHDIVNRQRRSVFDRVIQQARWDVLSNEQLEDFLNHSPINWMAEEYMSKVDTELTMRTSAGRVEQNTMALNDELCYFRVPQSTPGFRCLSRRPSGRFYEVHIASIVSQGLTLLNKIFSSTGMAQWRLIDGHTSSIGITRSLASAICDGCPNAVEPDHVDWALARRLEFQPLEDNPLGANAGYLLSPDHGWQDHRCLSGYNSLTWLPLRRSGYVFWDSDRVLKNIFAFRHACMTDNETLEDIDPFWMLDVKHRLKYVPIPKASYLAIRNEYSDEDLQHVCCQRAGFGCECNPPDPMNEETESEAPSVDQNP